MGCWQMAGDSIWGEQDEGDSHRAVAAAIDHGINFFDTAPAYGDGKSEEVLGRALKGKRDKAIVATKVSRWDSEYDQVIQSCERSLGLLQTDRIDLLQLHWPNHEIPFEETARAMKKLKDDGKVRHLAVCNFGKQDLPEYLQEGVEVVSNQLPYSLLSRAIEYDIVPLCEQHNISVLAYSPLLQGLLTGKYRSVKEIPPTRRRSRHFSGEREACRHNEKGCEEATFKALDKIREIADSEKITMTELSLAWILAQPMVANVLVGIRSPEMAEQNVRAAEVSLSETTLKALDEATAEVKAHLGNEPDLWADNSRFR